MLHQKHSNHQFPHRTQKNFAAWYDAGRISSLIGALLYALVPLHCNWAEEPAKPPQVLMCVPLGAITGQTMPVKARGLRLEGTTEVRTTTPGVTVKFLRHSKVGLPAGIAAERGGDTQVEFELTVSSNEPVAELQFVAADGAIANYRLPIAEATTTIYEVEPNAGFQKPQTIPLPQIVLGQIERVHDVDVYALDLSAGQTVRVTVEAQAFGSTLDPLLTLYDAGHNPVSVNDDQGDSRDAACEIHVAQTSRVFIGVQDANDVGGEAQPYRMSTALVTSTASSATTATNGLPSILPAASDTASGVDSSSAATISFSRQIASILQGRCVACHNARKAEGGYRMDSYASMITQGVSGLAAFTPRAVEDSEAFRRLICSDADERMPHRGEPLAAEQTELIRKWIEQGIPFDGSDRDASLLTQMQPAQHPAAPTSYAVPLPVSAVAFTLDGRELLVGGYHEITVWDVTEGKLKRRIANVAERTHKIALSPAGDRFAVAGGNPGQMGEVRLFHLDGKLDKVLAISAETIHDVAFSPAGDRLAIAESNGAVRIVEITTGAVERELTSHMDWVTAVAWSPDASKLASASRDKTAKVYDLVSGELLASYQRHDAAVRGILFHSSGVELFSSGANHRLDRWKIEEAKSVADVGLGGEAFQLFATSNYVVVPSTNNRVHLIKASDGQRVRELQGEGDLRFLSATAHEAADRIAAGTLTGQVLIWELSTGKKLIQFSAAPAAAPATDPAS